MAIKAILSLLLSLTAYHGDHETAEERAARMQVAAVAIHDAASRATCTGRYAEPGCVRWYSGTRDQMVKALVTKGWYESRFARYVGTGNCLEGPPGARCDVDPKTGLPRARSYWQTWQAYCAELRGIPAGSPDAVKGSAHCAARRLGDGYRRCGDWAGAFGWYARGRCNSKFGKRIEMMARL